MFRCVTSGAATSWGRRFGRSVWRGLLWGTGQVTAPRHCHVLLVTRYPAYIKHIGWWKLLPSFGGERSQVSGDDRRQLASTNMQTVFYNVWWCIMLHNIIWRLSMVPSSSFSLKKVYTYVLRLRLSHLESTMCYRSLVWMLISTILYILCILRTFWCTGTPTGRWPTWTTTGAPAPGQPTWGRDI